MHHLDRKTRFTPPYLSVWPFSVFLTFVFSLAPCLNPDPPSPPFLSLSFSPSHIHNRTHTLLPFTLTLTVCSSTCCLSDAAHYSGSHPGRVPAVHHSPNIMLRLKDLCEEECEPHKPQPPHNREKHNTSSMWREAMRKRSYLLERGSWTGDVTEGGGVHGRKTEVPRLAIWFVLSYEPAAPTYCFSAPHVMGACLALWLFSSPLGWWVFGNWGKVTGEKAERDEKQFGLVEGESSVATVLSKWYVNVTYFLVLVSLRVSKTVFLKPTPGLLSYMIFMYKFVYQKLYFLCPNTHT